MMESKLRGASEWRIESIKTGVDEEEWTRKASPQKWRSVKASHSDTFLYPFCSSPWVLLLHPLSMWTPGESELFPALTSPWTAMLLSSCFISNM